MHLRPNCESTRSYHRGDARAPAAAVERCIGLREASRTIKIQARHWLVLATRLDAMDESGRLHRATRTGAPQPLDLMRQRPQSSAGAGGSFRLARHSTSRLSHHRCQPPAANW